MMIASLLFGGYLAMDGIPLGLHPMFSLSFVVALGASLAMTIGLVISARDRENVPGALCIMASLALGAYLSSLM